jgi:hypothetical protein
MLFFSNQMGKTHSKPLSSRHGRGTAWARHAMCESAFKGTEERRRFRWVKLKEKETLEDVGVWILKK